MENLPDNLQLELKLRSKILSLNGKPLKLEDTLFSAELTRVIDHEDDTSLELRYQNRNPDFLKNEAENIYLFLDQENAADKISVNFYSEIDFPTIALVGRYSVNIHN